MLNFFLQQEIEKAGRKGNVPLSEST
jgi:hypothetical protein